MLRKGCDTDSTGSRPPMLIPPTLEVFVLWHPDDGAGQAIADAVHSHFHGAAFSGLVGGAVEVYVRSAGWLAEGSTPRPLPGADGAVSMSPAAITVVVPVLGVELARAAQQDDLWREYLKGVVELRAGSVEILPTLVDRSALSTGSELHRLFGGRQLLQPWNEQAPGAFCRDLSHSIRGFVDGNTGAPLRVFISHTKRLSADEGPSEVHDLVAHVREVLADTHLTDYFDERNLLPGAEWEQELRDAAASSAMLVVRTDKYSSRDWCQREVFVAKGADMPIVAIQALSHREERGSFLMDHMPAVALRDRSKPATRATIEAALNRLVDEALKRSLWRKQADQLTRYGFDWLPANAPELVTLASWLRRAKPNANNLDRLFVLHPDPPLGPAEDESIQDMLSVAGLSGLVEILTPRTFANRGGQVVK